MHHWCSFGKGYRIMQSGGSCILQKRFEIIESHVTIKIP